MANLKGSSVQRRFIAAGGSLSLSVCERKDVRNIYTIICPTIICPTIICRTNYQSFVLQLFVLHIICPTNNFSTHHMSYREQITSFVIHFICPTLQLSYNHLSYKSFVLHIICPTNHFLLINCRTERERTIFCTTIHLHSTLVVLHKGVTCPTIDNIICSIVMFKKMNLISLYMLNNISSYFVLVVVKTICGRSLRLGWARGPSAAAS